MLYLGLFSCSPQCLLRRHGVSLTVRPHGRSRDGTEHIHLVSLPGLKTCRFVTAHVSSFLGVLGNIHIIMCTNGLLRAFQR